MPNLPGRAIRFASCASRTSDHSSSVLVARIPTNTGSTHPSRDVLRGIHFMSRYGDMNSSCHRDLRNLEKHARGYNQHPRMIMPTLAIHGTVNSMTNITVQLSTRVERLIETDRSRVSR